MMGVSLVLGGDMVVQYWSYEGLPFQVGRYAPVIRRGTELRSSQFHLVEEALGFCREGRICG
jgi:hypothetical protein